MVGFFSAKFDYNKGIDMIRWLAIVVGYGLDL